MTTMFAISFRQGNVVVKTVIFFKKMILKKAKNLYHVIRDERFEPRGDVMDLILEGQIL